MKNILIGTESMEIFLGWLLFAFIGAFVSLLLQTTNRDISATHTPFRFSWDFLFSDNAKRILTTILLIYISLRFTKQILGITISDFWALIIGLGNDKLAQLIKNKTNILGK